MLELLKILAAVHSWIALGLMVLLAFQARGIGACTPGQALVIAVFWPGYALYFTAVLVERRVHGKKRGRGPHGAAAPGDGYQPNKGKLDTSNPPGKSMH